MAPLDMELLEGALDRDPALEVALPLALLDIVAGRRRGPTLRIYRPPPTVAFGRRDVFLPGFSRAAAAARKRGFNPVVRGAGGRAAAYDKGCLVFDEIVPTRDSISGIRDRFAHGARRQAHALRSLGVDARVGEVPGEYCPGEFTVNARGRTKLIGSAQRIVRGAWLFSAVIVVTSATQLRGVLEDVYAELELEWDPVTAGAVTDEVSGVGIEEVKRALLDSYATRYRLVPATIRDEELAAATELLGRHRAHLEGQP